MSMIISISRSMCMSNDVRNILACLMSTAELVRDCKRALLDKGFTKEETNDLLKFYVYDQVNKED